MEDVVRRLERLQKNESEEEEKSKMLTRRKQEIWDEQYPNHHKHLESRKGHYEAVFIINEILGPRPETPLLDDIATQEQLDRLDPSLVCREEKKYFSIFVVFCFLCTVNRIYAY